MLSASTKNIVLGNIQLINYCENQNIDIAKLHNCNIEKMGNKYFFVLPQKNIIPSLDNDIASQPNVVLTMDASSEDFNFENTEWTSQLAN